MRLFPTDQPKQSYRLKRTLLAAAFYALCAMFVGFGAWHGLYPSFPFVAFTVGFIVLSAAFFTIIRLGWNLRCKDPSLTEAQIGCSAILCSYVVLYAGAFRGVSLMAYVIALMFGGPQLTTKQLARLAALPLLFFPILAFVAARQDPAAFDWRIELVNWLVLFLALAFTVILTGRLNQLQSSLKASNAELEVTLAKLTDMAVHDELTGLYNRRYLLDILERAKGLVDRRRDGTFCACLIDIDHFKRINDTYGHGDGDTVLSTFAKVAEQCMRSIDFVGRWGGEEFLLLLPQTSLDVAATCVERIRSELASTGFAGLPPDLRITISAGIAQYSSSEMIKALIERADHALYSAKRAGRNRIVIAEADDAVDC